jgi:hypothetical protein
MESTNRTVDMVVRLTGGASTIVRGRRKDIRSIRKNSPEVRSGAARSPDGSLSNCSGDSTKTLRHSSIAALAKGRRVQVLGGRSPIPHSRTTLLRRRGSIVSAGT